jgi:hypothetical protein
MRAFRQLLRGPNTKTDLRRPFVVLVVGVLIFATFTVGLSTRATEAGADSPLAAASTPTYSNWPGYAGASAIYATEDGSPTYLPAQATPKVYETSSNDSGVTPNGIILAEKGPGGASQDFDFYQYSTGGHYLNVQIAYGVTGISDQCTEYIEAGGAVAFNYQWTAFQSVKETVSGIPTNASVQPYTSYWVGENTSTSFSTNSNSWTSLVSLALDTAGLANLPETLGMGFAILSYYLDIIGVFSAYSDSDHTSQTTGLTGPGSMTQWAQIDNGSWWGDLSPGLGSCQDEGSLGGNNTFTQVGAIELHIFAGSFGKVTPGAVSIQAQNQMAGAPGSCPCASDELTNGATTSPLSYGVDPAVSIGGTVYSYPGGPVSTGSEGANITLQQNCGGTLTDFVVPVSGTGYWHFFADPGCTYTYTATYDGYWYDIEQPLSTTGSIPTSWTSTADAGDNWTFNIDLAAAEVNFSETGLPTYTYWAVTFNGLQESQEVNPISFLAENGSWSYSIGAMTGYTISPSSGTISVSGQNVAQTITFTLTGPYSVSFSESGLPSGDSWSVTLGSATHTMSAPTGTTFSGLGGTNTYSVSSVIVSESCTGGLVTVKYYDPSPDSGTVTGAKSISVKYTLTTKSEHVGTCGEPASEELTLWGLVAGAGAGSSPSRFPDSLAVPRTVTR